MSSTKLLGNKGKTQNTCHKNLRHTYTCKAFMQLFIQRDSTLTLTHTHTHSLNWLSLLLKAQRQQYISMSEGAQQLLCHRVQSPADNSHRSHTNKRKLI